MKKCRVGVGMVEEFIENVTELPSVRATREENQETASRVSIGAETGMWLSIHINKGSCHT